MFDITQSDLILLIKYFKTKSMSTVMALMINHWRSHEGVLGVGVGTPFLAGNGCGTCTKALRYFQRDR